MDERLDGYGDSHSVTFRSSALHLLRIFAENGRVSLIDPLSEGVNAPDLYRFIAESMEIHRKELTNLAANTIGLLMKHSPSIHLESAAISSITRIFNNEFPPEKMIGGYRINPKARWCWVKGVTDRQMEQECVEVAASAVEQITRNFPFFLLVTKGGINQQQVEALFKRMKGIICYPHRNVTGKAIKAAVDALVHLIDVKLDSDLATAVCEKMDRFSTMDEDYKLNARNATINNSSMIDDDEADDEIMQRGQITRLPTDKHERLDAGLQEQKKELINELKRADGERKCAWRMLLENK